MLRKLLAGYSLMLAMIAALPVLAIAAGPSRPAARITAPINANSRVTLYGSVHPLVSHSADHGAAPESTPMNRMLLVLKRSPEQDKALTKAIGEMGRPGSKTYRKWLTPEQIGASYGPSTDDIATVSSWLSSSGFRVASVSRAGSSIEFSGTAGQVAAAFHTQIHSFALNGKVYTANVADPQIPAALAPVVGGIASLNNFPSQPSSGAASLVKFDKHTKTWSVVADASATKSMTSAEQGNNIQKGTARPNLTSTNPNDGAPIYPLTPYDFATIYNIKPLWDAGVDGSGQQIAVLGYSDVTPADIDQFRSSFGLPPAHLNTIHGGDDPGVTQDGAQIDATAAVEWAGAIAKNATIDLVTTLGTAASDGHYLSMTYAVDNLVAPVITDTNLGCESALGPAGNLFVYQTWQQAAAEGITVVTATGNSGAAACDVYFYNLVDNGLAVNGFASTPFDVAVGGTDFSGNLSDPAKYWSSTNDPTTQASALSYMPEIPWNSTCASPQTFAAFGATSGDQTPAQWCDDVNVPNQFLSSTQAGGGGASTCTTFNPAAYPTRAYCVAGYPKPDWQASVNGVPSDSVRDIPDVSFFGGTGLYRSSYLYCMSGVVDFQQVPACDYTNPDSVEYFATGSTLYPASAFAGVMALVNQKTSSSQGLANSFLYALAQQEYGTTTSPNQSQTSACNASSDQSSGNSCVFYDITVGTNSSSCEDGSPNCINGPQQGPGGDIGVLAAFSASPGYDAVTGLGSMNIANLVNQWSTLASATVPTTTTLSISSTNSSYGQPITISGTVTAASGSATASGTVAIIGSLQNQVSIPVVNGAFSQQVTNLLPGAYSITANYIGEGGLQNSSSAQVALVIAEATATNVLTLNATDVYSGVSLPVTGNNIPYGTNFNATMSVTTPSPSAGVAAPSGSVTFSSGGTTLANVPLTNGIATYQAEVAQIGAFSITASYSGDANYNVGTPVTQSYNVVKAPTSIAASASSSMVAVGSPVTLTAKITANSRAVPPTGQVVFSLNGTVVGTTGVIPGGDPVTGEGTATASLTVDASAIPTGADQITAAYSGDGNFLPSTTSAASLVSISGDAPTTLTMTSNTTSTASDKPVTILATLTVSGVPVTLGSVQFSENGKTLATVPIVGLSPAAGGTPGTAKLITRLAAGTHVILGIYSGAGNLLHPTGNVTPAITITAAPQVTTTSLSAAANATIPANYDVTATVLAEGGIAPSGAFTLNEPSLSTTLKTATIDPTVAIPGVSPELPATSGSQNPAIVVADFNGDGIPDFAAASDSVATQLMVSLGNGDGTFQPATGTIVTADPTITVPGSLTVGDYNADGVVDVAMTFGNGNAVILMLGNGDGTFRQGQLLRAPNVAGASGAILGDIVTADFNSDGVQDLALVNDPGTGLASIQIYSGNGDGTFIPAPATLSGVASTEPPSLALHIITADLNGDGKADLIAFSHLDGDVVVSLGNGDGTFQTAATYATGLGTRAGAVGDVNNDGYLDIVAPVYDNGEIAVLINNHDGTFSGPQTFPAAYSQNGPPTYFPGPNSVALGDVNNDGNLDIVVADSYYNQVSVIYGNGSESLFNFWGTTLINTQGSPYQVVTANLAGNGYAGILVNEPATGTVGSMLFGSLWTQKFTNVALYGSSSEKETLTGGYSGDSSNAASTSPVVTLAGSNNTLATKLDWSPGGSTAVFGTGVPASTLDAQVENNVPGTITYTAQQAGAAAIVVNAGANLPAAGAYTLTATFTPTNTSDYAPSTATSAFTVSKANVNQALASSTPQADAGATLTLIDTVTSSTSAIPTGIVNFFSGANSIGSATLDATGIATLNTATLASGSYTITASYVGDGNFNSATSTAVSVAVGAPSLTLALDQKSLTVSAGATAIENVTITPLFGYTGNTSLNCGNMPPGVSCSFSPATGALGSAAMQSTLTITTPTPSSTGTSSMLRRSVLPVAGGAIAFASMIFFCLPGRRRRNPWIAVLIVVAGVTSLAGCGGSSSSSKGSPATTLNISSSAIKSASGSAVNLTATLTGTDIAKASGAVTFFDSGTQIGQGTISNGSAQLSISTLSVGGHSITASYAGDSTHSAAGTASAIEQVITGQSSFTVTVTSGSIIQSSTVNLTLQ